MDTYLPEGMNYTITGSAITKELLCRKQAEGAILELPVTLCDEQHNLHVELGTFHGIIPRKESVLGIETGSVWEIAILSCVGKRVCCKIIGIEPDGNIRLSRKAAQEAVLEIFRHHRKPGDILPARITGLAAFGAFCDVGCGLSALLRLENIAIARLRHSSDLFHIGQQIFCIFKGLDSETNRIELSHKELLGTWEENAALFQAGQTVTGRVSSVKEYGIFVELTPNLSGLAEFSPGFMPGDPVCVYIKAIQTQRRKLKLIILGKLDTALLPEPIHYFQVQGHLDRWQYCPGNEKKPVTVF